MGEALGGRVVKSDKGWGIGRHTYEIIRCPDWAAAPCPPALAVAVSHQDQVVTLPPAAGVIARSDFTPFAGRLYFDDNGVWKYIEPSALADTGLGDRMLTLVSALGAAALALGLIGVTMARRRRSQNWRSHAHHGDRR
jgi:hypothetical protein